MTTDTYRAGAPRRARRASGDVAVTWKELISGTADFEPEDDAHLMEAIRYIVLNPVRAGLYQSPADWPWSSYRACVGTELAHPFLSVDRVLGLFGTRPAAARAQFRAFVREGHVRVSDTGL